jgi:hypothetical protein
MRAFAVEWLARQKTFVIQFSVISEITVINQYSDEDSAMNARMPTLVVLYDGNSALWRREIARFDAAQAQVPSAQTYRLKQIDIRHPSFHASAYGFALDMLESALLVRDERGLWHSGFAAMCCLFAHIGFGPSDAISNQKNVVGVGFAPNLLDSVCLPVTPRRDSECANDACLQLPCVPASGNDF